MQVTESIQVQDLTANSPSASDYLKSAESYFMGKGNLIKALELAKQAQLVARNTHDINSLTDSYSVQLRVFAESSNYTEISKLKIELQDLVFTQKVSLTPKIYYTLGICSHYNKQYDIALDYFNKCISESNKTSDMQTLCLGLIGRSAAYRTLKFFDKSDFDIETASELPKHCRTTLMDHSIRIFKARLLSSRGQPEKALDQLTEIYEVLKGELEFFHHFQLIYEMGRAYKALGNNLKAKLYFELVLKMIDPSQFVAVTSAIKTMIEELNDTGENYDIVVNPKRKLVRIREKGTVELKNQFILMDLMSFLVEHQGNSLSKTEIVRRIWNQDYSPSVHDNKLYVTVRRLREVIEPNSGSPKYIFRSKEGYFLEKNAKVKIEN